MGKRSVEFQQAEFEPGFFILYTKYKPELLLSKGKWIHWTGITPGLTNDAYATLKEGLILSS